MKINSIIELADYVGVPGCFTGDYERAIERVVYKQTMCGCLFEAHDDGVTVTGYAEGADAECEGHVLEYPFDGQAWDAALAAADADGCELFHEWNDPAMECPRCGDISLRLIDEEQLDEPDAWVETYECSHCGHIECHTSGLPSWYDPITKTGGGPTLRDGNRNEENDDE